MLFYFVNKLETEIFHRGLWYERLDMHRCLKYKNGCLNCLVLLSWLILFETYQLIQTTTATNFYNCYCKKFYRRSWLNKNKSQQTMQLFDSSQIISRENSILRSQKLKIIRLFSSNNFSSAKSYLSKLFLSFFHQLMFSLSAENNVLINIIKQIFPKCRTKSKSK